jgi:hypothetical protein
MLLISRAHGRFLGPLKLTDAQKRYIAAMPEREFLWLCYYVPAFTATMQATISTCAFSSFAA